MNSTLEHGTSCDRRRPSKWAASETDCWPHKIRFGYCDHHETLRHESCNHTSDPRAESRRPFTSAALHSIPQHAPRLGKPARTEARSISQQQVVNDAVDGRFHILQPETRPISQEQLVNEVKSIYAGLVMVERKCIEICAQQSQATYKLSNEQWQALVALHRTFLREHHDFFLASQHPTASPMPHRRPTKCAMPAQMWRIGIGSFLELLRHRLPYSQEHTLRFVYLAYQMMGLLVDSTPALHKTHETWIDCLGDLAGYRMALEETDMRDRKIWSNVARTWYNKAADHSTSTGRIQHHLAILPRPKIVFDLFYYSKTLIRVQPFLNALKSLTPLVRPRQPGRQTQDTTALERYTTRRPSLAQRVWDLKLRPINALGEIRRCLAPRPPTSRAICWKFRFGLTGTALAALSCLPIPVSALGELRADSGASGNQVSWTTFGDEMAQNLIQTASSWGISLGLCVIFNLALCVCGPARRTDLLAYGAFIWSVVDLGLFDKDATSSPQSKVTHFLEAQLLIGLHLMATVRSRLPKRQAQVADLLFLWCGAGMGAGFVCVWTGGSTSFPQIFPFIALALVELTKHALLPSPLRPIQGPLLPTHTAPTQNQA